MSLGAWVLIVAVAAALVVGVVRTLTNGVFRGTHRVRGGRDVVSTSSTDEGGSTDGTDASVVSTSSTDGGGSTDEGGSPPVPSVLHGTTYDGQRGEQATLLQFSSAFCAPCRATRRTLAQVAEAVPGVTHLEVDAESHLDLVRRLGVLRTPTTLVLDTSGRELLRATGAPRPDQVLAAVDQALAV